MMLKALLWKDFRQHGKFLVACGAMLLLPYVVAVAGLIVNQVRGFLESDWAEYFRAASIADAFLAFMMIAFIAGNAIAGDRADRSAEFTAYLPIDRKIGLLSKVITALGICVCLVIITGVIAGILASSNDRGSSVGSDGTLLLLSIVFSLFGVAWFFSSFLRSPAIAAAIGIAFPFCLGTACGFLGSSDSMQKTELFTIVGLAVGLSCFAAGVVYYLRRVEP